MAALGTEIPNNESLSGMIDLGTHQLVAIEMPATWAGTAITFQAKSKLQEDEDVAQGEPNPEVWKDVYNDAGTEVSITVGANQIVGIATAVLKDAIGPLRYIRLRSGTSGSPVQQSPSKQIKLIVK
jgi:hypothetical protein